MSEGSKDSSELKFTDEDILEFNQELIARLRKGLRRNYQSISKLFDEGKVELEDNSTSIVGLEWEYVFTRPVPEYLQMTITKRPLGRDNPLLIERVDIVYGENPLIQYDTTREGEIKEPPIRNTPEAVKKVAAFVSELERQL